MSGQKAVASGAARVFQAGRDLHVYDEVDHRRRVQRKALKRSFARRDLPLRREHVLRAPLRGREDDLAFLRDNVTAGRPVVLAGPRGIGKSLLLQHAANTGVLAAGVVADDARLLWLDRVPACADDIVQELVHACYKIAPRTVVPDNQARRLLGDIRALVVLDGVDLPPEETAAVLSAMPRSVFVLASRRDDLGLVARQRSLGGLRLDDAVAMVRDASGDPVDHGTVERDWDECDGNPREILKRIVLRDAARGQGEVPGNLSGSDPLAVVVPELLTSLTDHARNALRVLVAFGDVDWGEDLIAAVSGAPDARGAGKLARKGLAHHERGRYHVGDPVAGFVSPVPEAELPALVDRVTEWVTRARPDAIGWEIGVIERALTRALDAGMPDTALPLARAASAGLMWSRHWGAWAIVLGLGLRAAIGAESVRDEVYFRYALAVRRLNDGDTEEAARLLAAAVSLSRDDDRLTTRVRELQAQVQHVAARPPLSTADTVLGRIAEAGGTAVATGAKAVRQVAVDVLARVPGSSHVVRLAQENPALVRGVVSVVAVAGLALTTMTASGNHDQATALSPASPTTTAVGLPADPPTESARPGTTTAPTPAPAVPAGQPSTTTGRSTDGMRPGGEASGEADGDGQGSATTAPSRPTTAATWGFARVWYVDRPIGSSHELSGPTVPDNGEANSTYGPWRMTSSPARHPTATHTAVGIQQVRLPGVGAPGGSVKVTVQDYAAWTTGAGYPPGGSCQPAGWRQDGADEVVDVACFDRTGTPADLPFLVRYVAGSASAGRGFVFDDQPTAATFIPDWKHGVNAGAVTRTAVGHYTADLPGSAGGVVEVNAVGTAPRHCAVTARRGQFADLACTAPGGVAADSMFTVSFAVEQNVLDDPRKPVGGYLVGDDSPTAGAPVVTTRWASGNGPVALERISTGKYKAHYANGYLPSTVHVTAMGYGNHCGIMFYNDYSRADDTWIWVACFDSGGTPVNTGFTLVYTSARVY